MPTVRRFHVRAKFTDDDGKHNLTINFEVCRIEGLSDVIGVRPKRIKGDTWLYKKVLVGCLCGDGGALESIEARRRFFSVSAESKLRHGEYSCVSTCVRACVRACVVCSVWSISLSSCDCRQSNTGWFPPLSFGLCSLLVCLVCFGCLHLLFHCMCFPPTGSTFAFTQRQSGCVYVPINAKAASMRCTPSMGAWVGCEIACGCVQAFFLFFFFFPLFFLLAVLSFLGITGWARCTWDRKVREKRKARFPHKTSNKQEEQEGEKTSKHKNKRKALSCFPFLSISIASTARRKEVGKEATAKLSLFAPHSPLPPLFFCFFCFSLFCFFLPLLF